MNACKEMTIVYRKINTLIGKQYLDDTGKLQEVIMWAGV